MATITGSSQNGWYLRLDYSVTQDTANNQSTIAMTLSVYDGTGYSQNENANQAYYVIQGEKRWNPYHYYDSDKNTLKTLGTKTVTYPHNADGTKTVTLSASWCCGFDSAYTPYSLSLSGAVTLPTIPRATTPSMPAATMGSAVTISTPRASSAFTHTLRYSFGNASGTIAAGVGTSYSWTVPLSLASEIPNAKSGTGTLTCQTYKGATLIGTKSVSFTASVPNSLKPTVASGWASVTYDNSGTAASGIAAWVQGYSKAKATFDSTKITYQYGAALRSYAITYLGVTDSTSPYKTGTIKTTSATVRCTVTDSRGLSRHQDFPLTLNAYAKPALVSPDLLRSDASGNEQEDGTHIAGIASARYSSIGGLNSVTLTGYWKVRGGSYGSGVAMTSGQKGIITGSTEISAERTYLAKIVVTDSLGNSASYEEIIPTEAIAFHLKAGGKGAAFGKVAETDNCLELASGWSLKLGTPLDKAYGGTGCSYRYSASAVAYTLGSNISSSSTVSIRYYPYLDMCHIRAYILTTSDFAAGAGDRSTLLTISSSYKPTGNTALSIDPYGYIQLGNVGALMNSDGEVRLHNETAISTTSSGWGFYISGWWSI